VEEDAGRRQKCELDCDYHLSFLVGQAVALDIDGISATD
jgi:hypothetical protein